MIEEIIRCHYPLACTGRDVTERYLSKIEKEYGADLKKMLFATSLCSDDVNVSTDFRKFLNRPFSMGGLCGFPFTGYTGMKAFANHIPEGGDAFIFYGPHIGITDDGELGRLRRFGQSFDTDSCGAIMIALKKLTFNGQRTPENSEWDYQQLFIEQTLSTDLDRILKSEIPEKEITEIAYVEIYKMINTLINMSKHEFHCKRIFLLGGIIINTSPGLHDYVDIRNFEIKEIEQ